MKSFAAALLVACAQGQHYWPTINPSAAEKLTENAYGFDPWGVGALDTIDRSKWYSPFQEYSTPRKPYRPGTAKETVFAIA